MTIAFKDIRATSSSACNSHAKGASVLRGSSFFLLFVSELQRVQSLLNEKGQAQEIVVGDAIPLLTWSIDQCWIQTNQAAHIHFLSVSLCVNLPNLSRSPLSKVEGLHSKIQKEYTVLKLKAI